MVLTAHRGSHRCAQGNSECLPKGSRGSGVPSRVGAPSAGKTGHTGDPRLLCAFFEKRAAQVPLSSIAKYLRSVPGVDRAGPRPWPQWHGDLARPGVRPRFCGRLSGGEALRAQASRTTTSRSGGHHPHGSGRRSASRLRQWSDGARTAEWQVSPDAAVRVDSRLQPQIRALAGVAIECTHLGRTA